MNNTPQSLVTLAQIVRSNTTPVDGFIVSRPIFDMTKMVQDIVSHGIINGRTASQLYDIVAKEQDLRMSTEDMHFDVETRVARVLNDIDAFITEVDGATDVLAQMFQISRLHTTYKSRAGRSESARDSYLTLPFQIV